MGSERKKSPKRNKLIGVFDSGFGGLNIMKRIVKELPDYSYIYLGDNARAPYGSRSEEVVYNFTKDAVDFLFKQNCHLVILACNTASSHALRKIQREYLPKHYPEKRVLGVVIPTLEDIIENNYSKRVGVVATEGTVASGVFETELKKMNPKIEVFQKACPLLVPALEAGEKNSRVTNILLKDYLSPLLQKKIDSLVLGCTHYGLLEDEIKNILKKEKVRLVVEDKIVAGKLKDYLRRHPEIEERIRKGKRVDFFSTDLTERFKEVGSEFYGKKISPKKIKLGKE